MTDLSPLMNKQEVADYMRKTRSTVDRWVKEGKFPPANQFGLWNREEVASLTQSVPTSLSPYSPEAIRARTEKAALLRRHSRLSG